MKRPPVQPITGLLLTAALFLFTAGCQPVPQPFAHSHKTINPVAAPSLDLAGVTILPIPGLPDEVARRLSLAMSDELLAHEIIAGPDSSNRRSRFIQGGATRKVLSGGRTEITVQWDLTDRDGKILGTSHATHVYARNEWLRGGKGTLRPLVRDPALAMARLVKGEDDRPPERSHIALHVWPLDGAPDEATIPLRRAMETALKKRDFRVTDALESAGLIIAGSIELGPEDTEPRPIRITWSVMDTAGQELGNLTQQNTLPRQEMALRWNALAMVIADNAAGGVSDLVVQLPRNLLKGVENLDK